MSPPRSLPEADERTRRVLSPVALKASRKIGEIWGLAPAEIAALLGLTTAQYEEAVKSPQDVLLAPEQFDRAGLLIAIFRALGNLLDQPAADRWPRQPNRASLFGGRTAMELMQAGGVESMKDVLRYLRAVGQGL